MAMTEQRKKDLDAAMSKFRSATNLVEQVAYLTEAIRFTRSRKLRHQLSRYSGKLAQMRLTTALAEAGMK